jgi:nitroimidazol reductase NimA-like FMN-containing flavoprotein (pyridoxamine 5'-phosphate oxidase superfamily)
MQMSWNDETEQDDSRPPTRALGEDECWEHIAAQPYGRVAASAAGEIDIFPVNHRVDGRTLVFRTAAGTKLLELTIHSSVAFQVDGRDGEEVFSVVVKGRAEELQTTEEIDAARALDVRPWAPEPKDRWVRIVPREVTGRAFTPRAGV